MRKFIIGAVLSIAAVGFVGNAMASDHHAPALTVAPAQFSPTPKMAPPIVAESTDNGSVQLTDDPAITAGACRGFTGGVSITVCVPLSSPSGASVTTIFEDGSAEYADGATFEGDRLSF